MSRYLLILLILLAGVTIAGGIYKWVDEQGTTIYLDTPAPGKATQEMVLPPQPPKEVLKQAQQELEILKRRKQPQEVLGTIALGFVPTTALATLPEPPISLTVVIKSLEDESQIKFNISDPSPQWEVEKNTSATSHQNFTLSLRPGRYQILALEVEAESLSDSDFLLVTKGPRFTVPEGNCIYVGRLTFMYMRLPPGPHAQAMSIVRTMAKERGQGVFLLYLRNGALIGASTAVDTPGAEAQQRYASSYNTFTKAREKNCDIQLAKF